MHVSAGSAARFPEKAGKIFSCRIKDLRRFQPWISADRV